MRKKIVNWLLIFSARNNFWLPILKFLIWYGAEVRIADSTGNTAAILYATNNNGKAVVILADKNEDVLLQSNDNGDRALSLLAEKGNWKYVLLFAKRNTGYLFSENRNKHTIPTLIACMNKSGCGDVLIELASYEPDILFRAGGSWNTSVPIFLAANKNSKTLLELVKTYPTISDYVDPSGDRVYIAAAKSNLVEVVLYLANADKEILYRRAIPSGISPDSGNGEFAAIIFAMLNNGDAVHALARITTDVLYQRDSTGKTAIEILRGNGNHAAADYLESMVQQG